jgi:hypothetical protein
MLALCRVACVLALVAQAVGCERARAAQTRQAQPAAAPEVAANTKTFAIEAGELRAGSMPGSAGREAANEADLAPVALGAFAIDRKPRGSARDPEAAQAACEDDDARLCDELEWEQACVRVGAVALNVRGREWAAGEARGPASVARGSASGSGEPRCAARAFLEASAAPQGLPYRCCTDSAPSARYPSPAIEGPAIAPLERTPEQLASALVALAPLEKSARGFTPFSTSDIDDALRRGKRSRDGITTWTFLPASFVWRPARGEELHVVSGRAGNRGLLAVLYPLADGSYAHAASAVLEEGETSIAIGFRETAPAELLWTTCYGCPAEGGAIRYVDGGRPTIDFH